MARESMNQLVDHLKSSIGSAYRLVHCSEKLMFVQVCVDGRWYKAKKCQPDFVARAKDVRVVLGSNDIIIDGSGHIDFRSHKYKAINVTISDMKVFEDMDDICRQIKHQAGVA